MVSPVNTDTRVFWKATVALTAIKYEPLLDRVTIV